MSNMLSSKQKADIALTLSIADLTAKGYLIYVPLGAEQSRFDYIAYKDGIFLRIQCKYCADGLVSGRTVYSNTKKITVNYYSDTDFDYYAIYLPVLNIVVYPSVKYRGITLTTKVTNNHHNPYYFWEDFKEITNEAVAKRPSPHKK